MSETPKWNETQKTEPKGLEKNIKIDLKNGKIDITADNKLTKSELTSIEKMLIIDKNEILWKTHEELTKLKQVVIQDLKNRLDRGNNSYISSLITRTEKLLNLENKTEEKTETTTWDTKTWNETPVSDTWSKTSTWEKPTTQSEVNTKSVTDTNNVSTQTWEKLVSTWENTTTQTETPTNDWEGETLAKDVRPTDNNDA